MVVYDLGKGLVKSMRLVLEIHNLVQLSLDRYNAFRLAYQNHYVKTRYGAIVLWPGFQFLCIHEFCHALILCIHIRLISLTDARRKIETISNFEDKVVYKRVTLIGQLGIF